MLKASRLVPAGTFDNIKAGGLDVQGETPRQEKESDIAPAVDVIKSSVRIATMVATAIATGRFVRIGTS